jgi:hypothetical protein
MPPAKSFSFIHHSSLEHSLFIHRKRKSIIVQRSSLIIHASACGIRGAVQHKHNESLQRRAHFNHRGENRPTLVYIFFLLACAQHIQRRAFKVLPRKFWLSAQPSPARHQSSNPFSGVLNFNSLELDLELI